MSEEQTPAEITTQAENPETAITKVDDAYFEKNRNLGLLGIGGDDLLTPILKVIQPTSKDRDVNGAPYRPGLLYYKASNEVFETLDVVMLAVTKGVGQSYDKQSEQSQFVFMGIVLNTLAPFKWYAQGSQYYEARKFLTAIRMTKKPMYTQQVHITIEKQQNDKGEWFIAKFNIAGTIEDSKIPQFEKLVSTYMGALEQEQGKGTEDVNPEDIPF